MAALPWILTGADQCHTSQKPNSQLDSQHFRVKLKGFLTAFHCPTLIHQSLQHLSWSYSCEEYFVSPP